MGKLGKFRQGGHPAGIIGVAIAALVRHDGYALEPGTGQPVCGSMRTLKSRSIIVHHHHSGVMAKSLRLKRIQRHHQMVRPAECGQRDHHTDAVRIEVCGAGMLGNKISVWRHGRHPIGMAAIRPQGSEQCLKVKPGI